MKADGTGSDAVPSFCGLDAGGEVEVGEPELQGARVLVDGALENVEGACLGGVGGGVADFEAGAAFGAEAVEGGFPGDVGEEVGWFGTRGEDEVLVVGAFDDEGADFLLEFGRSAH